MVVNDPSYCWTVVGGQGFQAADQGAGVQARVGLEKGFEKQMRPMRAGVCVLQTVVEVTRLAEQLLQLMALRRLTSVMAAFRILRSCGRGAGLRVRRAGPWGR